MSQITERTNIISIAEIPPVPEVHASMVNLSEMSNYQPFSVSLPDMKSMCPQNILNAINATNSGLHFTSTSTSVSSPNLLRAAFANSFAPNIKKLEAKGLTSLDAKKASLISSISKMDFKITDRKEITTRIKAVMNAKDEKTLNTEIKSVLNNLEVTHTKVFASNLAKACAAASLKAGFKQVEIKQVNGKLEVIATNSIGQRLNSEISIDAKTNNVNANTETIGITDGSCNSIISTFNNELKKMGIKIGDEKTTFTGGACQLSYSKMIDQQDKETQRKKKEQERLKKLNSTHKQKI
jgi:hypothetical protein